MSNSLKYCSKYYLQRLSRCRFTTAVSANWNRSYYKYFLDIQSRVTDNDMLGHINNAVYYSYFDTVINHYLNHYGGQNLSDKSSNTAIPYCVSSSCIFKRPLSYPQLINAGISITKIGNSSVIYDIGIFKEGDDTASATGNFVHVFVDQKTEKSKEIPDKIRSAAQQILVTSD
eukprot:158999_1